MTLDLNWHSAILWEPPPPPETETKPIKSVASRTPRWVRHCSATCHFTAAKITQSDAFNYMSYHFLCKWGIRPARTEQFLVSLLISSISVAYWVTASTPPCLMLLLIFMGLVVPCLVLMVAVRFWLRRSVRSHVAPSHPCLFITYMMASSHALS